MIILLILISATAIFNVINIGNKDNKDILSNKNDGLVVNEEIMINEEANDVTILEDVEKEQINKLYSEEIYYKLALAYEDTDLNKSKEYAEHIKKEFSNSIYNNSKISQIISK